MRKTFYEKVGRRYKPVYEYDSDLLDSFGPGFHLVHCEPGVKSTMFNVLPDRAPVLAAIKEHRELIIQRLREASSLRLQNRKPTPKERRAWKAWAEIMGDSVMLMESASLSDLADALEKAVIEAMEKK